MLHEIPHDIVVGSLLALSILALVVLSLIYAFWVQD